MIRYSLRNICIIFLLSLIISYSVACSNANRFFRKYNNTVVNIFIYNEKGLTIAYGSGFIVSSDGAIVTNYHVVSYGKNIKVIFGNEILDIEGLIYADIINDLVILKAKGKNLPTVKIGDIGKINVGEEVYVISSSCWPDKTISEGVLSEINEIASDRKMLEITAPFLTGSSGAPVFNKDGEVIGIATLMGQGKQNIYLAMPVNLIKDKISIREVTELKDAKIEDYEKTVEYWLARGCDLKYFGLYKEAIEAYTKVIRINPNCIEAYYGLGVAYGELGEPKKAMECYKQVIKVKPDDAESHYGLGVAYSELGMNKEAIEAHKKAISIKPNCAEAYYNLGISYGKLSMHKESVEAYEQATKIKPNFEEAHYNLGITYCKLNMYHEATEAYEQAIKIKPNFEEAHYNLGNAYCKLYMYEEAIEPYKQAIRIKPNDAKAHYNLGCVYLAVGKKRMAIKEYKILKNLNPEEAEKLFNLIYK